MLQLLSSLCSAVNRFFCFLWYQQNITEFGNTRYPFFVCKQCYYILYTDSRIISIYKKNKCVILTYKIVCPPRVYQVQTAAFGYGQCNTKGTLFMALLRAVGIPCRIHGFTIDKSLQKGAMTEIIYNLAPQNIVHSWVEIYFEGKWLNIEGFILDILYLNKLQEKFSECNGSFCGYGVATDDFKKPQIDWNKNDTYIQKEGINQDFGIFNSPDEFFIKHSQEFSPLKKWIYQNIVRKLMNRNVSRIRER